MKFGSTRLSCPRAFPVSGEALLHLCLNTFDPFSLSCILIYLSEVGIGARGDKSLCLKAPQRSLDITLVFLSKFAHCHGPDLPRYPGYQAFLVDGKVF